MNRLDFYSIVNSRLLTVVLSFNISFVLILYLTSDFPQSIGSILVEHLSYQSLEETDHSVAPAYTEHPPVFDPSPDWLVDVLNDDDLPCETLPSPTSGQRHGYSYPPWDASDYRALRSKYLPFQPQQQRALAPSIRSELDLAESCADLSITNGTLCGPATGTVSKLDVVWTFANGSGVLHEKWRRVRQVQQELERSGTLAPRAARLSSRRIMAGTEKKLFRDHDELRHSMRSVLQHFRPFTSQFHLVTSDFAFPSCDPDEYAGWRLGQIPQWLDLSRPYEWTDGRVELNVVPHANLFNKDYRYTTFNSLAIESQFANLNVSDAFIYLNDDFYFAADLSPWDFHTPSFGLVLRMQPDLLVSSLEDDAVPSEGEWHSLEFSNRLLSDRFGLRRRPYVIHEAKALKRSLISEISLIWSTELAETSSHPFRTDPLLRDAHMGFIAAHFVVERWREGLLWSWIVARVGRANDEWDSTTLAQAWFELGGTHETPDMTLWVSVPERDSLSKERMAEAQALVPGAQSRHSTIYAFTSQDGYPYTFLGDRGSNRWPEFPAPHKRCSIEFEKCFPSGMTSASEMFKHVAFVDPQCGDCIINALVTSSGRLGLSAFLPPVSHSSESLQGRDESSTPHLPLVSDYRTADFSLQAVVGDSTDVRSWTVNMLQRYRFVIGDTPSIFAMVRDALSARTPFESMDANPSVALLCLNDDITDQPEESDGILRQEQQKRWPHRASWEIRE